MWYQNVIKRVNSADKNESGSINLFLLIFCLTLGLSVGIFIGNAYSQAIGSSISATDINSLRGTIDTRRNQCGISDFSWTNEPLSAGVAVKTTHFQELRTAINEINTSGSIPRPATFPYTAGLATGQPIRSVHRTELGSGPGTALDDASCCGDGTCDAPWEVCGNCPDCSPCCGDGICNGSESCSSCPGDCGICDPCSDGICNTGVDCSCPDGHGDCSLAQCIVDPCNDGVCNQAQDCTCPDGHGDCSVAQCTVDPCSDGTCDIGEDCTCPDGHGDCSVAQCTDPCDDGTCNTGVDCSCPDGHGDCSVAQCTDPCDDGTCNTGVDCSCPDGHGDCSVAQCTDPCDDGTCNTGVDCSCPDGHGDCTVAQCCIPDCSAEDDWCCGTTFPDGCGGLCSGTKDDGIGQGCFIADTFVDTPNGPIAVQNLKAGDAVYSYDPSTNKTVIGFVDDTFIIEERQYGDLTLSNGKYFGVSDEHPFYLPREKRWAEIGTLSKGAVLQDGMNDDAREVTIKELTFTGKKDTVYNIKVAPYENYYVNGVLVHNKACFPCGAVHGEWCSWGSFGPCVEGNPNLQCQDWPGCTEPFGCVRTRVRSCACPPPSGGGLPCDPSEGCGGMCSSDGSQEYQSTCYYSESCE